MNPGTCPPASVTNREIRSGDTRSKSGLAICSSAGFGESSAEETALDAGYSKPDPHMGYGPDDGQPGRDDGVGADPVAPSDILQEFASQPTAVAAQNPSRANQELDPDADAPWPDPAADEARMKAVEERQQERIDAMLEVPFICSFSPLISIYYNS